MARNFLGIASKPYIGTAFSQPITLCDMSRLPPASVPFNIDWQTYGAGAAASGRLPNVGVNVQVSTDKNVVIDVIRGVYIDNLACDVPVYVYFPSTDFTVAAQPNATMFFPVLAADMTAVIIGEGFTDFNRVSRTKVLFTNVNVAPYIDNELLQNVALYRASPAIQRGLNIFNSDFAPPALGDQTFGDSIVLSGPAIAPFFPVAAQVSGFYYVTGIVCRAIQAYINPTRSVGQAQIRSTGISGVLYRMTFGVPSETEFASTGSQDNVILSVQGMNLKLDATEPWIMQNINTITNGFLQWYVTYTYQPDN